MGYNERMFLLNNRQLGGGLARMALGCFRRWRVAVRRGLWVLCQGHRPFPCFSASDTTMNSLFLRCLCYGFFIAGPLAAAVVTSFEEDVLPAALVLDVPRPAAGSIVFDALNDELDFLAAGNTDMWSTRNNAAIAWTSIPAGLTVGAKWVVETEVRLNNAAQNNQVAGLTFYGGPDGARPDITFGLDNWDPAARAVRLQGLGDNVPNAAVTTTASRVILRVEVEEGGATDTYNFFFRETTADSWVPLPGAAVNYRSTMGNARVGLTYKTAAAKAGASFTSFYVVGASDQPPIITSQPASVAAIVGGVARFAVSELGAATYQWRRGGVPLPEGGDRAALVIDPVQPGDEGASFDCVLTNASGSTVTQAVTMTVSPVLVGGGYYASAVRAEPSLFAYFPVDGSPAGEVINVRHPESSGILSGAAVTASGAGRTVGTKSVLTDGGGWVAAAGEPGWDLPDGRGTIELFLYQSAVASYNPGLVSVRTETATRYTLKADAAGGKVHLTNGTTTSSWILPSSSIGRLVHLAAVLNNGKATLYHNGETLGEVNLVLGPVLNAPVTLGSTGPGGRDSFPGSLDEIALYTEPLPAAAIAAHYQAWLTTTAGAAPVVTTPPVPVRVNEGGTATFRVDVVEPAAVGYRWQRDGVDIPGATSSTLELSPVTLVDNGVEIRCVLHNPFGGALTEPVVLTVNDITPPQLLGTSAPVAMTQLLLTFNEPVEVEGATFQISGGSVTSVGAGPLPGQLRLTLDGVAPDTSYTLTLQSVRDRAGNGLAPQETVFTTAPRPVPAPLELVRPRAEPIGPATRRGPFVFSEIHYHPSDRADGKNLEFIEIYNSQPWPEDLSGFRIEGEVRYTLPAGTRLASGARLVVAAVPADVMSVYGLTEVMGPWDGSLNNGGGELRLRDISEAIIFEVLYDASTPWPAAPDGSGHSLVLARPSYGMGDPRSWDQSVWVGGSPAADEPILDDPYRAVRVNEVAAAGVVDFIELYNYGLLPVDLAGCMLSDEAGVVTFVVPSGVVVAPGGWVSWSGTELGFGLKSTGDTVYFRAPAGGVAGVSRVVEAVRFGPQLPGTTYGRYPDGARELTVLRSGSPGAANVEPAVGEAVISEIHFGPPAGSRRPPFIEITNMLAGPLDLSGWQLSGGVSHVMPAGTVVAAGGQLAVTAFSGSLNRGVGERIRLRKPVAVSGTDPADLMFPVVDEVTYGTGGRWGRWSDGGGSSLELKDLRSDGRRAASWADSDESGETGWVTIETTGQLVHGSGSPINRLHVMLLGAGECLIDDVEVIPAGSSNRILNGGFESGTASWLMQGTHEASSLESSGFSGRRSLHVRAAGRGDLAGNRITVPLSSELATGMTATLRARVKWLRGHPEILLRLQGGTLEATGNILPPSLVPGTPGAPNSMAMVNAGPVIDEVTHRPVLPQAGQTATVYARVADPDGLSLVLLQYRLDPSTTRTTIVMTPRGAGWFSAELPAQPAGKLVAFTLTAHDTRSASSVFPDHGEEGLIRWGDPPTPPGALGAYRFWMTEATRNAWTRRMKNSNSPLGVTFIYGDWRIIHQATAQYSGSPWHTGGFTGPTGDPCDYDCTMPEDDRLLGETDFLFAGPGTFGDDTSLIREQTIWWMARRLGAQSLHRRFGRVYVNGVLRQRVFEDAQQPNGEWIDAYWPDDDGGRLHKAQDWIEYEDDGMTFQTTLRALMTRVLTPEGGHQSAAYRFQWAPRSVAGSVNDWSDLTTLVDAFNTGATAADPAFFKALDPLVDEDSWMRALAIQRISGNWDTWGWKFGKNMYIYKPQRGPWAMTAWDIDFSFGLVGEASNFNLFDDTQDPLCTKFRNQPAFRRAYWAAFREAVDGPMLAATVNGRIDAMVAGLQASGVSSNASQVSAVKSYVASRRNYIVSQLNAAFNTANFAISGSAVLTDDDGVMTLSGTAPPGVKFLKVNGVEQVPQWMSQTVWRLPVTLYAPQNVLTIEGVDRRGQVLGSFPVQVTVTSPPKLPAVTINEWMADNPPSSGLTDPADGRADDWFELHNAGSSAVDLGGFFLTDDETTPAAFQIPAGTVIPAGGYLLVWADGDTVPHGTVPLQLHAPFKLNGAGESLQLRNSDGTVVDAVDFGAQIAGVSEGRYPAGGPVIGALTLATPGQPNAWTRIREWTWHGPVLQLTVDATAGLTYQLEVGTTLADWRAVGPARRADGPVILLEDATAPVGGPRFYRVVTGR